VFLFSMIAAVPTLLVVIFASLLFQSGVEFWFSDNSRGMLENANKLAQGYYEQSRRDVSDNAWPWPMTCATPWAGLDRQPDFAAGYSYQVLQRKLDEVACFEGAGWHLNTAAIIDPSGKPRDGSRPTNCAARCRRADRGQCQCGQDRGGDPDRPAHGSIFAARRSDLAQPGRARREHRARYRC
jgi:two-component system nitrogen regulation sensor histidine kinase NtrY